MARRSLAVPTEMYTARAWRSLKREVPEAFKRKAPIPTNVFSYGGDQQFLLISPLYQRQLPALRYQLFQDLRPRATNCSGHGQHVKYNAICSPSIQTLLHLQTACVATQRGYTARTRGSTSKFDGGLTRESERRTSCESVSLMGSLENMEITIGG